jgi:hypothetical protein
MALIPLSLNQLEIENNIFLLYVIINFPMNCLLFPSSILICNSTAVCKILGKIYHSDEM